MAIRWSTQYPGQVSVDPGYPHGKPRNVAVPGDGSGTPLEAAWVSDLAGWQAALLEEAGITPSGQPDKLGASDYTDAIKFIAGGALGTFTSTPHTWTAPQTFQSGHVTGDWGVGGEVRYVDAGGVNALREREVMVPLTAFAPRVPYNNLTQPPWQLVNDASVAEPLVQWRAPGAASLYGEMPLPYGSELRGMRMHVQSSGNFLNLFLNARQASAAGNVWIEGSIGSRNSTGVLEVMLPTPLVITSDTVIATAELTSSGGSVFLNWVKLVFGDPGPRNS